MNNSSKARVREESHSEKYWTAIPNSIVFDIGDCVALSIYVYLATRPAGWECKKADIMKKLSIGARKYNNAMGLLKEKGFVENEFKKGGDGKILGSKIIFHAHPRCLQNVDSTKCNDILLKEKNNNNIVTSEEEKNRINYQDVVNKYHECLPDLPRVKVLTDKRKQAIKKLSLHCKSFEKYFAFVNKNCEWMKTEGDKYFKLMPDGTYQERTQKKKDFDFIMRETTYQKVKEEAYIDKQKTEDK